MKKLEQLLSLFNKTAIVTGGANGIGYGISYRLAEAGAKVLIADVDITSANQAVKSLVANGWVADAIQVDVSEEEDIKAMLAKSESLYGSVDILVNNAGIYPPTTITNMSEAIFERVIQVNLKSVFLGTKYGAEIMKTQGGGKIINITSIDALHPSMIGLAHYDASKHAVWGFTKNSALEFANDNIQINAIAPGGILTPGVAAMSNGASVETTSDAQKAFMAKIPMRRMGEADEIGMVALFLASDMSSYMTGEQIVVDGGALLC